MAIERGYGSGASANAVMGEDGDPTAQQQQVQPRGEDGNQETAELPLSMAQGQELNPGDVIRLQVISVNADQGSVTVAYAQPGGPGKSASDQMADEATTEPDQPMDMQRMAMDKKGM